MKSYCEKKLISVIIPVHNTEKYLDRCLESIIEQTYGNFEIILSENGSSDGSLEKCREWAAKDSRIKVLTSETSGVSAARNLALSESSGEYIAFADSDDKLSEEMFETGIKSIEQSGADLFACAFYNIYPEKTLKASFKEGEIIGADILRAMFSSGFFLCCWNKIFKRETLISENGEFIKFDENVSISEDSLWLSEALAKAKKAVYIDKPLYYWLRRSDSATRGSSKVWLDERALTEIYAWKRISEKCRVVDTVAYEKATKQLFLILKKKLFEAYRVKNKTLIKEFETEIRKTLQNYKPSNSVDKVIVLKFRVMKLLYKIGIDAENLKLFSSKKVDEMTEIENK